jgi:hypothetical protein
MRAHYDSWWAGVEPLVEDFSPVILGAEQENLVRLTADENQWRNRAIHHRRSLGLGRLLKPPRNNPT